MADAKFCENDRYSVLTLGVYRDRGTQEKGLWRALGDLNGDDEQG